MAKRRAPDNRVRGYGRFSQKTAVHMALLLNAIVKEVHPLSAIPQYLYVDTMKTLQTVDDDRLQYKEV